MATCRSCGELPGLGLLSILYPCADMLDVILFFFKQKTAYEIVRCLEFRRVLFRSHGVRPPKGEVYFPVEGANGELGFYVVSDGTSSPYRVRVRPPCFAIMSALPKLLIGDMMADLTPTFGSINMIGGELDR